MLSKQKRQRNTTTCISYGALGTKEKKQQQKEIKSFFVMKSFLSEKLNDIQVSEKQCDQSYFFGAFSILLASIFQLCPQTGLP